MSPTEVGTTNGKESAYITENNVHANFELNMFFHLVSGLYFLL